MKTTIDIADDVLDRAKALARRRNTTLKSLTEEGLRFVLDQDQVAPPYRPVTVRGSGPAPELPEDFWDNIRDYAYDEGRGG